MVSLSLKGSQEEGRCAPPFLRRGGHKTRPYDFGGSAHGPFAHCPPKLRLDELVGEVESDAEVDIRPFNSFC